jgi:hypothetical protein
MRIYALFILLGGCTVTTAQLSSRPPSEVVHSKQPRTVIADCLLDRIASDELIPARHVDPSFTTINFNSRGMVRQPAVYSFVVHDEPSGSMIEVRRFAGASLASAETCF